jgi:6-phosphogluconolactonase (cycloisomerase 2 family)
VHPSGAYVLATNGGDGTLSVFSIAPATGALTAVGAPLPVAKKPTGLVIQATGDDVFVTDGGADQIVTVSFDTTTGVAAVSGSPLPTGHMPVAVSIDPNGLFVMVPNSLSNDVSVFKIRKKKGGIKAASTSAVGAGPSTVTSTR